MEFGICNKMKKLKGYFKENITAYTYIFFAQTLALAINLYLKTGWNKEPTYFIHFPLVILFLVGLVFTLFLPTMFLVAAFTNFEYTDLALDEKVIAITINLFIILVVFYYAFTTTVSGFPAK